MDETLGTVSLSQTPSASSRSLISQANMLSGDVAGPDALVSQLHDPLPHHVREGSAVHKHPAELVHAAVPCVGHNSSTGEHRGGDDNNMDTAKYRAVCPPLLRNGLCVSEALG
ncbi:hypothetical protein EYF80_008930 [Liparis tanakae]|uniref:Uncharacterized protein n=1 Tax=Liparis tanakae TaxID=230148 RepID=A0A4Z2ISP6_9TELE|nr:hypothetical protein EYF80_008930 [Liparis tanakae]